MQHQTARRGRLRSCLAGLLDGVNAARIAASVEHLAGERERQGQGIGRTHRSDHRMANAAWPTPTMYLLLLEYEYGLWYCRPKTYLS